MTKTELQTLIDFTVQFAGTKYESLNNNCTTYAVEAWNLVNDKKPLNDSNIFNIDDFDIFYICSDKTLVPDSIALSDVVAMVDEENTFCNVDISWKKSGKEMYDGTIMLNKVRVVYYEDGADPDDYVDVEIDADKGGCILGNLEKHNTYIIRNRAMEIVNNDLIYS